MDTSKLKKFAQFARRTLHEQVTTKLALVLSPNSAARRESPQAVKKLEEAIAQSGGQYPVIERVAYTWFNRFCALRFMDVNRYTRIGVVSPAEGQFQPEILLEAKMGHFDEDMVPPKARQKIADLLAGRAPSHDGQGEAYRLLVVAACNAWHQAMPFLFQRIDDYTELLMPDDLLSGNAILAYTREAMTPDACKSVEVIGWLYQFYISEKKDSVFEGLKKNQKITPDNIPAATQLFTPHWIVRYLVDNSLGRLDIMKNYMANKSFSRGVETLGAEASMVFVGNTDHTVPYMLKHSDLFDPLPEKFHDSAFLDRIHSYIPGWEVDVIRAEMFSAGYGFVVDYLAEILRSLRSHDYSDRYKALFTLGNDISTRDRDGINKTFSGLMKLLFPDGQASDAEIEEVLRCAIEGRKRVKDQLLRIDATYPEVSFAYLDPAGQQRLVHTLEEDEYPHQYHRRVAPDDSTDATVGAQGASVAVEPSQGVPAVEHPHRSKPIDTPLKEQHLVFQENQRGVSFDSLFGPYLAGAKRIVVTDPYLRMFHQLRNLMELMETISKLHGPEDEVAVHVVTVEDEFNGDRQTENLQKIADACTTVGIQFTWFYDTSGTKHDRDITTDHGWKIVLSRGLDVFQRFELNDAFNFANRLPQQRQCKEFNVTYVRL